jgi:hypothetical protein
VADGREMQEYQYDAHRDDDRGHDPAITMVM